MKSIVLSFLVIIGTVSSAQKLKLGPEMGFNLIHVESTDLGNDFQLGFNGGANIEYHFTNYFSVRSGLFASQKRQAYGSYDSVLVDLFGLEDAIGIDDVNLYSYTTTTARVSQFYLEIPVLAAYTYKRFSVFAGPYFGYMLTARTREVTEIRTPFLQTVDVAAIDPTGGLLAALLPPAEANNLVETSSTLGLNAFDYGIKFGLRYEWENLGINANYLYGIPDFQTVSKETTDNHTYLQLTLNYNFGLGK